MAKTRATYISTVTVDADDTDPNVVNLQSMLLKAQTALSNNQTFLALGSPTNAQTLAQVQALTRQMNAVIRLITNTLDSTSGT